MSQKLPVQKSLSLLLFFPFINAPKATYKWYNRIYRHPLILQLMKAGLNQDTGHGDDSHPAAIR